LADPVNMILLDARSTSLFRWSWMLSIFGYYLFLIPVAVYLSSWLGSRNPGLIRSATIFGYFYICVGAVSVAVMVGAALPMMQSYAQTSGAQSDMMLAIFQTIMDIAFVSLSSLAFVAGGLWWSGVGSILLREHRILGVITLILGAGTLGSGIGSFTQIDLLARLEMVNYFLTPIWAIWLGIMIIQHYRRQESSLELARAAAQ